MAARTDAPPVARVEADVDAGSANVRHNRPLLLVAAQQRLRHSALLWAPAITGNHFIFLAMHWLVVVAVALGASAAPNCTSKWSTVLPIMDTLYTFCLGCNTSLR